MLRYFSLWFSFYNNSLTRDLEYKANFLGGLLVDTIFYGIQYFYFSVIFHHGGESFGIFSKEDVMIFLVVTFLADTLYMFFFAGNIFNINRWMVHGDLDFFLLKPINSQFMVSFRYVKSYAIASLIILSFLLIKLVGVYSAPIPSVNIIAFLFSLFMGMTLWYCVDFMISCSCFWVKNFSVAGWLSHEIMKFSTRPDTIYTGILRKVLFSLLPMIFIASNPTRTLLHGIEVKYLCWQVILTIIFLLLTFIVWKKGLLRYESASS